MTSDGDVRVTTRPEPNPDDHFSMVALTAEARADNYTFGWDPLLAAQSTLSSTITANALNTFAVGSSVLRTAK